MHWQGRIWGGFPSEEQKGEEIGEVYVSKSDCNDAVQVVNYKWLSVPLNWFNAAKNTEIG